MDQQLTNVPTDDQANPTSPKRPPTGIFTTHAKRPTNRSNAKLTTDYLLDENRIGLEVHRPHKKRRYVSLYLEKMMTSLLTLYSSVFKVHWTHFRNAETKFPTKTGFTSVYDSYAAVYLSHWLHDLYRINRKCLESIDPIAFAEKYHHQVGAYSDVYDNFLSTVAAHIRPTHISGNYSDDIYIPVVTKKDSPNNQGQLLFDWAKYVLDGDLFYLILEIFEHKKFMKMTPISSDLLGRPSWLFDWSQQRTAFAWFPQEGNYNDEDIAVAYVIGDTCTPKLGHSDIDDWKYTNSATIDLTSQDLIDSYKRVVPRRYHGCAEFRIAEVEAVHLPNYYEDDQTKFRASNIGPIQLVTDYLAALPKPSSSTTTEEEEETDTEGTVDTTQVPASPRYSTRSRTTATQKHHRTRVIDRLYYAQVIKYFDTTSRFTAFKLFNKYD